LDLISYLEDEDERKGEFVLILKNKIQALKEKNDPTDFEKTLYDFIKSCDSISVADFIANMDNLHYNKLTNGYDEDYLKSVYECVHAKTTIETVKQFLKNGNCYVA
jgi:hypothetical protein